MFEKKQLIPISSIGLSVKQKFYSEFDNLYFVSPSKWLYECARRSKVLYNKPVFYIPNVIHGKTYQPITKEKAKDILNLSPGQKVLGFGSVAVDSPYKGWKYLSEALALLHADPQLRDLQVLIFGEGNPEILANEIPFPFRYLGYLSDELSTVIAYNAADVIVVPSVADNQPTTVQESLSCGTAVVGFETGGIPDMIMHKKNGYLARSLDSRDLYEGIKYCILNSVKGYVLPQFDSGEILAKHLDLFDGMMKVAAK
jgi:glycosyltransferase involved in cell wall biosynthesis